MATPLPPRMTPAAAYGIVAGYLADAYFTRPPDPGSFTVLVSARSDRRETRWEMNGATARTVLARLKADDRVASVICRPPVRESA